jgi:hypothetical protein
MKQAALGQLKDDPDMPSGQAEEKVYDAMANDALESFSNKVSALFFVKEKEK